MAFYEMLPGAGMPSGLQAGMDSVLNKKFGTSTTYPAEDWPDTVNLMGPLPEKTVSGAIATFDDGADDVPLKKCEITLPASLDGYNEVNVAQTGKNLLDYGERAEMTRANIVSTVSADGTITASGQSTGNGDIPITLGTSVNLIGGQIYTFSINGTDTRTGSVYVYFAGGSYISINNANHSGTYTPSADQTITGVTLRMFNGQSITLSAKIMLEIGSTAHEYEPYQTPTTYTASLGRTIYGGTADVVNGQGESTHANVKVSDLTWTKQTASGRDFFIAQVSDMKTGTPKDIASVLPYGGEITVAAMADKSLASWTNSLRIYDTDITTVSELLEAYGNDGISYPLATPESFSVSPIAIDSKAGTNNTWNDSGETEVTYRADINLALGGN